MSMKGNWRATGAMAQKQRMYVTDLFALMKYAIIRQPGGGLRHVVRLRMMLTKQYLTPQT